MQTFNANSPLPGDDKDDDDDDDDDGWCPLPPHPATHFLIGSALPSATCLFYAGFEPTTLVAATPLCLARATSSRVLAALSSVHQNQGTKNKNRHRKETGVLSDRLECSIHCTRSRQQPRSEGSGAHPTFRAFSFVPTWANRRSKLFRCANEICSLNTEWHERRKVVLESSRGSISKRCLPMRRRRSVATRMPGLGIMTRALVAPPVNHPIF